MPITLPDDTTTKALATLRRYFDDELDHPLGELPARFLLEFILEEIGPSVYNAAIADAQVYLRDRVGELDAACYQPEFGRSTAASRSKVR
jgi:uncharacterized protein (DUF2164 family)